MYYVGSVEADENRLSHHGIAGMKWGRRRFQNEDGSLTSAGISRYRHTGAGRIVGGAGRMANKAARIELGLNDKKRKNTATENRIAEQYAVTKNAAEKYRKKAEESKSKGLVDDAEKGERAVESLEKELKSLKMDLSNYRSLPENGRKAIDRGYKKAKVIFASSTLITGGILGASVSAIIRSRNDTMRDKVLRGH